PTPIPNILALPLRIDDQLTFLGPAVELGQAPVVLRQGQLRPVALEVQVTFVVALQFSIVLMLSVGRSCHLSSFDQKRRTLMVPRVQRFGKPLCTLHADSKPDMNAQTELNVDWTPQRANRDRQTRRWAP